MLILLSDNFKCLQFVQIEKMTIGDVFPSNAVLIWSFGVIGFYLDERIANLNGAILLWYPFYLK
jgi:hypothetical protein